MEPNTFGCCMIQIAKSGDFMLLPFFLRVDTVLMALGQLGKSSLGEQKNSIEETSSFNSIKGLVS